MAATFELKTTDDSAYQFDFFNGKGEKLMESAPFASKALAEQAIKDVRVGSMMSEMIAVGSGPNGEKYFVIKNQAGDVLVRSAGGRTSHGPPAPLTFFQPLYYVLYRVVVYFS